MRDFAPIHFHDVFVYRWSMKVSTDVEGYRPYVQKDPEIMRGCKGGTNIKQCMFAAGKILLLAFIFVNTAYNLIRKDQGDHLLASYIQCKDSSNVSLLSGIFAQVIA